MTLLKKSLLIYGSILVAAIIFVGGWTLGQSTNSQPVNISKAISNGSEEYGDVTDRDILPDFLSRDASFSLFWDVWDKIQTEYIDRPVGETQLLYGSLHGLVASLGDPYSSFLEPQVAEDFTQELKGKFEGIGAEIGIRDSRLTIIAPLAESPAERAGLRGGDKVYAIDDFDTMDIRLDEAVNRIRGEKGTEVILTILHKDADELQDITITRDTIKIVSASVRFEDTPQNKKIAVLKVTNFNEDTGSRFRKAVNKALAQGAQGFILDLRNNPGGFLDKAVELAGYWVESGKDVVSEKFADGSLTANQSFGSGELANFKTIVLINGGSASASEIVAGALQDYGLATVLGQTSFGKGSVQDLEEFDDGSAVKLTIARWLTPHGRQIDANGIEPDEAIERTEEDFNADRDPQLQRALEILDEQLR